MRSLLSHLATLYEYRDLLYTWSEREIKIRYKQTVMGAAWAIAQPFALMIVFTLLFGLLVKVPTNGLPYPLFVLSALVPWTFTTTSISMAAPSVANNMALVTKTFFPREVLPLATIMASVVDLIVSGAFLLGLVVFYQQPARPSFALIPLIFAAQFVFTVGVCLGLSAMYVFFRDIRFVIPLALQLWLYATPVIYATAMLPEWAQQLSVLNPMVAIINAYRDALFVGELRNPLGLAVTGVVGLVICALAYVYFKRAEREFADFV